MRALSRPRPRSLARAGETVTTDNKNTILVVLLAGAIGFFLGQVIKSS